VADPAQLTPYICSDIFTLEGGNSRSQRPFADTFTAVAYRACFVSGTPKPVDNINNN
jgi:hypothetical protein